MKYIMTAWKKLENALVDATFAEVGCGTYCTCCNKRCRKQKKRPKALFCVYGVCHSRRTPKFIAHRLNIRCPRTKFPADQSAGFFCSMRGDVGYCEYYFCQNKYY